MWPEDFQPSHDLIAHTPELHVPGLASGLRNGKRVIETVLRLSWRDYKYVHQFCVFEEEQ